MANINFIESNFKNFNHINGLKNNGNTCYFNVIIQTLFRCDIFNKLLVILYRENLLKQDTLLFDYTNLLLTYFETKNNKILNPYQLYKNLLKTTNLFLMNKNEDGGELLNFLLDNFNTSLKNINNMNDINYRTYKIKDIMSILFEIGVVSYIKCSECKTTHSKNEPLFLLTLPINDLKIYNLKEIIYNYIKIENLTNENKYMCDICKKKVNAKKQLKINSFPKYLFIQLDRFIFKKQNNNIIRTKNVSVIDMPLEINELFFCVNINVLYELRCIIIHTGNLDYGHYICLCKIKKINQWILFNDDNMSILSENDTYFKSLKNNGYIYMYAKINN